VGTPFRAPRQLFNHGNGVATRPPPLEMTPAPLLVRPDWRPRLVWWTFQRGRRHTTNISTRDEQHLM